MMELALLGLLHETPRHGYELQRCIADLPGVRAASFGSLYPALRRLSRDGLITSHIATSRPSSDSDPRDGNSANRDTPMTGSLGGEVAAYRARRGPAPARRPPGRRKRKVYVLTPEGKDRLRQLVNADDEHDDSAADGLNDERILALRLAFAPVLGPDGPRKVLDDFEQQLLARREAAANAMTNESDPWLRHLHTRTLNTIDAEMAWVHTHAPAIAASNSVPLSGETP